MATGASADSEMRLGPCLLSPVLCFLFSTLCLLSLSACQSDTSGGLHEFSGITMGTTYSVVINTDPLPVPEQRLQAEINAILNDINMKMSTYLPESELMRLNGADSADWVPVSQSLLQVLEAARGTSQLTRGAFDVTIGLVVNLWGFGTEKGSTVPTEEQINKVLQQVGYEKLQLDLAASAVKKSDAGMFIDLSAIAKGYGVDKIADYLDQLELGNYLVEIGGEIRARGINSKNIPWQIGIEKPVIEQRDVQKIIKLDNIAMATSGDYRNFFEQDGNRYSHTIHPRTGRPVTHQLASVTVLHPSTMQADALATGLLVLGPEEGFALALKNQLAAYFIIHTDTGFREKSTPAFKPYFVGDNL